MTQSRLLISLFCGPGGLDEGFKQAGLYTRLAYDIDLPSVLTHRFMHPEAQALVADLSTIDVSEIIAEWEQRSIMPPLGIIGGPPCQSFSISNVHRKALDPRDNLPSHYARILAGLNARYGLDFFVFENVPGLLSKKHIEKFRFFIRLFEEAGFRVFTAKLDAKDFGVPQRRPRVFVVGLNKDKYPRGEFRFPRPAEEKQKTVRDAIAHLPEPVYYSRGLTPEHIPYHPNHWCLVPRSPKFRSIHLKSGKTTGRSFRILSWDKPSYTVAYGHREVHIHPNGHRRLSVYEAMLLQGFPPHYVLQGTLSDQLRQVSEAVPPPVARALACNILKFVNRYQERSNCMSD